MLLSSRCVGRRGQELLLARADALGRLQAAGRVRRGRVGRKQRAAACLRPHALRWCRCHAPPGLAMVELRPKRRRHTARVPTVGGASIGTALLVPFRRRRDATRGATRTAGPVAVRGVKARRGSDLAPPARRRAVAKGRWDRRRERGDVLAPFGDGRGDLGMADQAGGSAAALTERLRSKELGALTATATALAPRGCGGPAAKGASGPPRVTAGWQPCLGKDEPSPRKLSSIHQNRIAAASTS